MIINNFSNALITRLQLDLPGHDSHLKMSSKLRIKWIKSFADAISFKKSAVLILIYSKNNELYTILIQRPVYNGVHSNQICFPGGKFEIDDTDLYHTAKRECFEEVGVEIHDTNLLGELSELFIPPSRFRVLPVIASIRHQPIFKPNELEVQQIIEVKLADLFNEVNSKKVYMKVRGIRFKTPAIVIDHHVIWGATAMIIQEFKDVCSEIPINYLSK